MPLSPIVCIITLIAKLIETVISQVYLLLYFCPICGVLKITRCVLNLVREREKYQNYPKYTFSSLPWLAKKNISSFSQFAILLLLHTILPDNYLIANYRLPRPVRALDRLVVA